MSYGPQRPTPNNEYTRFRTPSYLQGHVNKIRADLERVFRLYSGKLTEIFRIGTDEGRCTTCTDAFTGAVLLENCPECGGAGYTAGYVTAGSFWALAQIGAGMRTTSEMGNAENTRTGKDTVVFVNAPLLHDTDLVGFTDTHDLYKVVDVEPEIVAMNGEVITQVAGVSFLTPGSKEYTAVGWL